MALARQLGDQHPLLAGAFVPGAVYHVDSVVPSAASRSPEAHAYGTPAARHLSSRRRFTTLTFSREAPETKALSKPIAIYCGAWLMRGVTHAEFLRSTPTASSISSKSPPCRWCLHFRRHRGATGVTSGASGPASKWEQGIQPYQLPPLRRDYAAVILSLARQSTPIRPPIQIPKSPTALTKYHHVGSSEVQKPERNPAALDSYATRFQSDSSPPARPRQTELLASIFCAEVLDDFLITASEDVSD